MKHKLHILAILLALQSLSLTSQTKLDSLQPLNSLGQEAESGEYITIILQYGINVAINISTQMIIEYMFNDEVKDWEDAWEKVSLTQAMSEGVVDMIPIKKIKITLVWANSFVQCLLKEPNIDGQSISKCGVTGLVDVMAGKLAEKYGKVIVQKGLKKIGFKGKLDFARPPPYNAKVKISKEKLPKFQQNFIQRIKKGKPSVEVEGKVGKTSTNLLKPLGLGSTGRTAAANLTEQLAMKEIISNPSSGKVLIQKMEDASGRWSGWSKMSNKTAHGVEIHYNALWENGVIKAIDDFKFIEGK